MSGLRSARVGGSGTTAWPLLVALALGLAACGPSQTAEQSASVSTRQASDSGSGTTTARSPPARANATRPLHVAPAEVGTPVVPRAAVTGIPARQPSAAGVDSAHQPIRSEIAVVHGGSDRALRDNRHVAAWPAPVQASASALRVRPGAHPDLASYVARVSASDHIELPGAEGMLSVWIGSAQNLPQEESGTASSTQSLGMRGQTATVTPFAPDFDVNPASTVCERVVPSGSVVRFALTPKHSGDLTVGANVQLFDSADCSGIPVPKSTSLIRVQVRVCKLCYVRSGLASMGQATWSAFSHFWTWLLGVIFVTAAVLINRWRRRKFHITKDDQV